MKKIFTLFAAVMLAAGAMAQTWYLGGNFGMDASGFAKNKSSENGFSLNIAPTAGYEFNNKWAIEFGGSFNTSIGSYRENGHSQTDSMVGGGVFVYGRYTAWNNGILFIDLKFGDEFSGNQNLVQDMAVFMPQFRVRVHDHVDLGVTLGKFGLGFAAVDKMSLFAYQLGINAGVNCVYRF